MTNTEILVRKSNISFLAVIYKTDADFHTGGHDAYLNFQATKKIAWAIEIIITTYGTYM